MNHNHHNYLNQILQSRGAETLKKNYHTMTKRNRQQAILFTNDENLIFPALFVLIPEINVWNLYEDLNERNKIALKLCAKKTNDFSLAIRLDHILPKNVQEMHAALFWMVKTGMNWDGPSFGYDSYDAVIDTAAAILIKTYDDHTILPDVLKLIFQRNRKDLLVHDLVWAFSQTSDPQAYLLIAKYLLSENRKDMNLACTLLHIKEPNNMHNQAVRRNLYNQYVAWFDENKPYLYFTGDHMQQTSKPNPLNVDIEAKYLGKRIFPKNREPAKPYTAHEISMLKSFRSIPPADQEVLSSYSNKIYTKNKSLWNEWIRKTAAEQVMAARWNVVVV